MDKLLNLLNELANKYNFEEEDIKKIQEIIFSIEDPDGSEDADMTVEDFTAPEEEDEVSFEEEHIGKA